MWLLIEKSTGIIRDTQSQPFSVTSDFDWVEDKSVTERSHVGDTYNKQSKVFTSNRPISTRPHEITQAQLSAKIDALQAQIDNVAQPVLGASQPVPQSPTYLYIAVTALIFLTFWITRLKYKK